MPLQLLTFSPISTHHLPLSISYAFGSLTHSLLYPSRAGKLWLKRSDSLLNWSTFLTLIEALEQTNKIWVNRKKKWNKRWRYEDVIKDQFDSSDEKAIIIIELYICIVFKQKLTSHLFVLAGLPPPPLHVGPVVDVIKLFLKETWKIYISSYAKTGIIFHFKSNEQFSSKGNIPWK